MLTEQAVEMWDHDLDNLFVNIGHHFGRVEPRRRMRDYVRGLLAPVARKNSWQLAEHAGNATPDGVLIVDDTGFLKKGTTSAGVQRQYSGTAGRTENCRIGVFAAYASSAGRAFVDRELYLPKSWTGDRDRCRTAKAPVEREFTTKGDLAKAIVLRVLASPLPISWVTAAAAHGQECRFRRLLENAGVGYVVAAPKSQFTVGCPRSDHLFAQAPKQAWERRSCGEGAKGPRMYDRAAVRPPVVAEFDYQGDVPVQQRWALARRSVSKPDEVAYDLGYAPLAVGVDELVRVAGIRWAIEECFQAAKTSVGWTSTRCGATSVGTDTSPSRCSLTPSSR
ncbi:IS701 family transposase [Streptomyces mayteni]